MSDIVLFLAEIYAVAPLFRQYMPNSSKCTRPMSVDHTTPFTTTGPTIVNIFTLVPKISPSVLYSIDALDIALAKPVMGKNEPAPPLRAITS